MAINNLDFAAQWDIDKFKAKCADQRRIAEKWPAYDKRMAGAPDEYGHVNIVEEYRWQMGPWWLTFLLEVWDKPIWHGSAMVLQQVGSKTMYLGRDGSIEAFGTDRSHLPVELPVDGLILTKEWEIEHYEQARFILAEVFGPILRPGDKQQEAHETVAVWGLHWIVPFEGKRHWLKNQH